MPKQTFKEWLVSGVKILKTNWKVDRVDIIFILKSLFLFFSSSSLISIGTTSILIGWYIGGLFLIPGALLMLYSFYYLFTD
jgi:hypothetical protein